MLSLPKDKPETADFTSLVRDLHICQETLKDAKVLKHLTPFNGVESRGGLDFFSELPDHLENRIEEKRWEDWAEKHF